jgi:hypothetical protein
MKKSELRQVIKVIVNEVRAVQAERILESKKGLSGMKKTSDKKDNTQMGYEDKTITSTTKPTEKKEGKKLPVKDKNTKGNTETDHTVSDKSTPTIKEELIKMIREALTTHVAGSQPPVDSAGTPPTEPVGAEDEEEKQPEAAPLNSLVNVFINGVKTATIDLKKDKRSAEAIVASALYGKGKNLDYDMDANVVPKMEELSDLFIDDKLPANAGLYVNTSDKKFVLGARKVAASSAAPAPVQTPPQAPTV